jgi:hypothetical protein
MPAQQLRRVNLIERQRDQSQSEAVSSAGARQRSVPTLLFIAAMTRHPPSRRRARSRTPPIARSRRAAGSAGADDAGSTEKHESGHRPARRVVCRESEWPGLGGRAGHLHAAGRDVDGGGSNCLRRAWMRGRAFSRQGPRTTCDLGFTTGTRGRRHISGISRPCEMNSPRARTSSPLPGRSGCSVGHPGRCPCRG